MSRTIIDVLVLTFLVSQVTYTFGRLTTFSGPSNSRRKKVICLSEDDGSALVWNTDSFYAYHERPIIDIISEFPNTCNLQYSPIDCKMDGSHDCLTWWNRQYWKLTNSIDTPMGLVFDQRWEEFYEWKVISRKTYHLTSYSTSTIVLPISIRATKDVHILICNSEVENDLCYWVIIGGWENNRSVIRKCSNGVPKMGVIPSSDCATERAYLNRIALNAYEWRSFILTWNLETRNISLYDTDQLIMTYADEDNYNKNFNNNVYMRSPITLSVRYQKYNYLYTTTQNAILTSNTFIPNTNVICLQILIGLCAECDADILLRNSITNEVLHTVTVKGSSVAAVHGLPMWQSVKIMVNLTSSYNSCKIVVIPKLNLKNFNPMWAIANVRTCFQKGCIRESVMSISQDWTSSRGYFWPDVTCQKLFYEEQSIVYPLDKPNPDVELDNKNCPLGYVGPACYLNCKNTLESQSDCKDVVICHNNGCTCPLGYVGPTCGASCDKGSYGHACKKKCGSCLVSACDRATGECPNGCKNTKDYSYVPPLCQIGIGTPQEIQISFMNQTTIVATVPMKWEKQYEEVELLYFFKIEMSNNILVDQQERKRIFQNTTDLIGIFTNLNPGTTYQIVCIFSVAELQTYSPWKVVNTDCDPVTTCDAEL